MRVTIKTKLICSFGAVLALLGTAGYFGISSLGQTNQAMTDFSQGPFVQVANGSAIKQDITDIRRGLWRMLVTSDAKALAEMRDAIDANWRDMDARIDTMSAAMPADQAGDIAEVKALVTDARKLTDSAMERVALANNDAGDVAIVETSKAVEPILAELGTLAAAGGASADLAEGLASKIRDARFSAVSAVVRAPDDAISAAAADVKSLNAEIRLGLGRLAGATLPAQAPLVQQLSAQWSAASAVLEQQAEIGVRNDFAAAQGLLTDQVTVAAAKLSDRLDQLNAEAARTAAAFTQDAQSAYESTRTMLLAIVVGAIAIGAAAAAWMAISISRGLNRSVKLAEDIGSGDLTQTADARAQDEIGDLLRAMNTMTENLRGIVSEVTSSAEQVAAGAQQTAATAEQLSQGATEQAASSEQLGQGASEQAAATEQASSAMEEMAANIRQNSENATTTEKIAAQASTSAEKSGQAVANSVEAMRTIADKIRIVQEIARQTDLLALNAAIEARAPASTARASRSWPPRCASLPSDPRSRRPRSASCRPRR